MFSNLKSKNSQKSVFKNQPPMRHAYSRSSGASSSSTGEDEADRLVRCRVCGFICDRDRDVQIKDGRWAGLGIKYGPQQTADATLGDAMIPATGSVTPTPDKYYEREISGGCPCCGTYMYDEDPAPIPPLQ